MILHDLFSEAANPAQQAAIAIAMKKAGKKPKTEAANPADTLYFFDVAQGGRSFDHLDLRIMGLKKSQKGRWYYQPGRDSTDLLTIASLKHLEKTLNVPARAWQRPTTEQQLDELDFMGSPCTKDCSGHRAGYAWSRARGGAQAASWSPSFNNGAAIASSGK